MDEKIIDRVFQYLDTKGVPHTRFEKDIGLSNGYLMQMKKKHADLGESIVRKIIDYDLHLNVEWLLRGKGSMLINHFEEPYTPYGKVQQFPRRTDTKKLEQDIPLYDIEAAAGLVQLFNEKQQVIDRIHIPNLPKCDGAIHITGDSMYPLLKSGDIVIYKVVNDNSKIFWGEMYLLQVDMDGDHMTTVKYVQKSEDKDHIKLVGYNQHHQPVDVPKKTIKAIAIVKATIRLNTM